jgi:plasmid maintenance system antidote protein VapI
MGHPKEKLQRWIEKQQLSQQAAGVELGCSQVHVSELVNGKKLPSRLLANRIERTTGIRSEEWDAVDVAANDADKKAAKKKQAA